MTGVRVRDAVDADIAAITAIYAESVLGGVGTFELTPPDGAEMARRQAEISALGLPRLVAEDAAGAMVGFAYAGPFRMRRAYRYSVEDSVYVAEAARGLGAGRALLAELVARCEALGLRQMVAVIGDSDNGASIALHRACGFTDAGVFAAMGWKFDRWLDVVFMQRALGPGGATPPDADGLAFPDSRR